MYKIVERVKAGKTKAEDVFRVYDSEDNDYTDYTIKEIYSFIEQGLSFDGATIRGDELIIDCKDSVSDTSNSLVSISDVRVNAVEEEELLVDEDEEYEDDEEYEEDEDEYVEDEDEDEDYDYEE